MATMTMTKKDDAAVMMSRHHHRTTFSFRYYHIARCYCLFLTLFTSTLSIAFPTTTTTTTTTSCFISIPSSSVIRLRLPTIITSYSKMLSSMILASSTSNISKNNNNNNNNDIAIIGCGVLGTSLCKQLLTHPQFANFSITGITKTTTHHEAIRDEILLRLVTTGGYDVDDNDQNDETMSRLHLTTMEQVLASSSTFRNVVFCAPPSGFQEYSSAIHDAAIKLWNNECDTTNNVGSFVFTSSGAVYEGADGETVNEFSATLSDPNSNPRAFRMIEAENAAIQHGGCALRLAGLYTLERGAHNYWLDASSRGGEGRKPIGREDGIVNLLHYDDAAAAVLAALKVGPSVNAGRIFLISDGNPTTRRMICESAMKHARYRNCSMPTFLAVERDGIGNAGPKGKVYDGSKSNEALLWKPKYSSFHEFMTA